MVFSNIRRMGDNSPRVANEGRKPMSAVNTATPKIA